MLLVQTYLVDHTFAELARDHGVNISVDSRHGHKFSLNYDMIESDENNLLAQQCRGLILSNGSSMNERGKMVNGKMDYSEVCPGPTQILAYPMNRFFNAGQGAATPISWTDPTLRALEKLDGTLCIVYFDQIVHEWHVATRSRPEAEVPLEFPKYTFRTLFEKALFDMRQVSFEEFCAALDPEKTYCFELTTPYNRIVVKYEDCQLHLLAVRHKMTLLESDTALETGCLKYVLSVPEYNMGSMDDVIKYVNERSPISHEGIVLRDGQFCRIKVKNASYVAFNRARDSLSSSPRGCLELVLAEKDDDVLTYMPDEIVKMIGTIKKLTARYFQTFEAEYRNVNINAVLRRETDPTVQDWNERKLFATCVQATSIWAAPCYQIFVGKCKTVKEYINQSGKDGSWSNAFLDQLLQEIGYNLGTDANTDKKS